MTPRAPKPKVTTWVNDDLVRFKGFLWSRGKARKRARCWVTGAVIEPGDEAWKPITDGPERGRRIKTFNGRKAP